MPGKNYQNRPGIDEVIPKIKWCSFLLTWNIHHCVLSVNELSDKI